MIVRHEQQRRHDVYGTVGNAIALQGQLMRAGESSDTVIIGMHPTGAPSYLPMFTAMARGGHHVLAAGNRYTSGDYSLITEKVLLDMGAWVRHAREELGYERVILVGWSGGAALAATYQAQAERPTITHTPDGSPLDIAAADLVPADAIMIIAGHRSRHHLLTEWLDASITDESDPACRDPRLDLFARDGASKPPFTEAFLAEYREAQIARNRRITSTVLERLGALRASGRPDDEFAFVVHGTMADPRWLDPSVDPNDRKPASSYLGEPSIANNAPSGLARYSSLRSWLSQWSYDHGQADAVASASTIQVPFLFIENTADDACPRSHMRAIWNAVSHEQKRYEAIVGADHYFSGPDRRQHLDLAVAKVGDWLESLDVPVG
jgi:dienelactone hydrolase